MIAGGHQFDKYGVCTRNGCNRRWLDIRSFPRECIGEVGIACVGTLTAGEWESIDRERKIEDERIANAMEAIKNG